MSIFKNSHTKVIAILIGVIFFANSAIVYAIDGPQYENNCNSSAIRSILTIFFERGHSRVEKFSTHPSRRTRSNNNTCSSGSLTVTNSLRVPSSFSQSSTHSNRIEESLGLAQQKRPDSARKSGPLLYAAIFLTGLFSFIPDISFSAQEVAQAFSRQAPVSSQLHVGNSLAEEALKALKEQVQELPDTAKVVMIMHLRLIVDEDFVIEMRRFAALKTLRNSSILDRLVQLLMHKDVIRDPYVVFDGGLNRLLLKYLRLASEGGDPESVFRLDEIVKIIDSMQVKGVDEIDRLALGDFLRNLNAIALIAKSITKGDALAQKALVLLASKYNNLQAKEVLDALKKRGHNLSERNNADAVMSNMSSRLKADDQFVNEIRRLTILKNPDERHGLYIRIQRLRYPDIIRKPDILFDGKFHYVWDEYLRLAALGDTGSVFRLEELVKVVNDANIISSFDKNKRLSLRDSLRRLDVTAFIIKANNGDPLAQGALSFFAYYGSLQATEVLKALKKQGQQKPMAKRDNKDKATTFDKIKIRGEGSIRGDSGAAGYKGIFFSHNQPFLSL